ncbi:hypothetical protein ACFPYJ_02325 [Paenibacillus solisilvae]|uniref:Uncharacterized protein n=1 Tax=Paenibacillus solisilvae TaxID=2486751 RepID=A0ABW0VQ02_9BACL
MNKHSVRASEQDIIAEKLQFRRGKTGAELFEQVRSLIPLQV